MKHTAPTPTRPSTRHPVVRWGLRVLLSLPFIATGQLPSVGQFASAPDEWLLSNGQPWHYQTGTATTATPLMVREPRPSEKSAIDKAQRLFDRSSAKGMALLDGNQVVWVGYKPPARASNRFLSFSIGKTVTAMAVGKALCAGHLALTDLISQHVPEFVGTDLGNASIEHLLKMSSGTWQGNPDSTIITAEQDQRLRAGSMRFLDVLTSHQVAMADTDARGTSRKPGDYFAYKSTDPLALGVAINQSTGTPYAEFVEREILLPAGIAYPAIIGQDRFGYGAADGNVRMRLEDWIRFAVWVKTQESAEGCFSNFVRQATTPQIPNTSRKSGAAFDGYGYLTWTSNIRRQDSYWAVGHGGQRIGWNHANNRMLIAFSNVENYMMDLYNLYAEWADIADAK